VDQVADVPVAGPAAGKIHKNHDIYFVPGLRRGLGLLEVLAAARRPLGLAELARELGLTRSSVFRLVYTLRHMGYLEGIDDSKSVTLGPRVLNIGFAYLASKDIIEVSRVDLEALRDRTNVTAHLAIRNEREVLYLNCVQTRSGFLSTLNVGARLPAYATPMGWLLLSDLSSQEIARLFGRGPLEQLTDQTPHTIAAVAARVAEAAAQGYAISRGAVEAGGSSIAAPVLDQTGRVVAAIDISGPDSAFELAKFETRDVREVVACAQRISSRLGHRAEGR
jgi:DNA-binding IclR family transcriptional regulator